MQHGSHRRHFILGNELVSNEVPLDPLEGSSAVHTTLRIPATIDAV